MPTSRGGGRPPSPNPPHVCARSSMGEIECQFFWLLAGLHYHAPPAPSTTARSTPQRTDGAQ
eukprot:5225389-Prymnesium_polylepis.1